MFLEGRRFGRSLKCFGTRWLYRKGGEAGGVEMNRRGCDAC
jgi:hypothetical protein